ncbi:MAG: proline dehydrogenase family protein [Actinomycetota bacterium]
MSVLRSTILTVANASFVKRVATGGAGRTVALRFVAGETLDDGMRVMRDLAQSGLSVSLDHLGENVTSKEEAESATSVYREAIRRIGEAAQDANVSVKLTQLGLDLDEALAFSNASELTELVASAGSSLTLDMEDHNYTDRTIDTCLRLHAQHPGCVGIAIQTYLYRSPADLERLLDVPVRLCKGAYKEDPAIAYPAKEDVDRAYASMTNRLLQGGRYPMIATHDDRLIRHTVRQAERLGRSKETFEFQMLYGIRRDLQRSLRADGYRVRVYVPFGSHWYPYLVRRLAERPANVAFFLSQVGRK